MRLNLSIFGILFNNYCSVENVYLLGGDMSKQTEHWGKTKSLLWITLIIWAFFAFIIHLFGTSLNGSFPGAYYMAGQGAQLAFVILTFWFASRQNKIDEEFGFSEDD